MSPNTNRIVASLQAILNGQIPVGGICSGLHNEDVLLFTHLTTRWPYHSGNWDFPIPSLCSTSGPEGVYYSLGTSQELFDGPYGVLRMDLCRFVLRLLEDPLFDTRDWRSEAVEDILANTNLDLELL